MVAISHEGWKCSCILGDEVSGRNLYVVDSHYWERNSEGEVGI